MKLLKAENFTPGTWRHWQDRDFVQKVDVHTAVVTCPTCGKPMSLREHQIAADGKVSPSLVCPHDCTFHEFVILEEWEQK